MFSWIELKPSTNFGIRENLTDDKAYKNINHQTYTGSNPCMHVEAALNGRNHYSAPDKIVNYKADNGTRNTKHPKPDAACSSARIIWFEENHVCDDGSD